MNRYSPPSRAESDSYDSNHAVFRRDTHARTTSTVRDRRIRESPITDAHRPRHRRAHPKNDRNIQAPLRPATTAPHHVRGPFCATRARPRAPHPLPRPARRPAPIDPRPARNRCPGAPVLTIIRNWAVFSASLKIRHNSARCYPKKVGAVFSAAPKIRHNDARCYPEVALPLARLSARFFIRAENPP